MITLMNLIAMMRPTHKDPDNWYETRDKDAAFKFILHYLLEDLKKDDEAPLHETRRLFRVQRILRDFRTFL